MSDRVDPGVVAMRRAYRALAEEAPETTGAWLRAQMAPAPRKAPSEPPRWHELDVHASSERMARPGGTTKFGARGLYRRLTADELRPHEYVAGLPWVDAVPPRLMRHAAGCACPACLYVEALT